MEVRRRVPGVARVTEVSDHGALANALAARDPTGMCLEMRVVVLRSVAPIQVCRAATQGVRTQLDGSVDHGNEWRVAGGEHVHTLVPAASGP